MSTSTVVDTGTDLGARAADRLTDEAVIWLVTVDPRGAPQPTPVWFWWDGDGELALKTQPRTAKVRNVRANPAVAVHLNSTATGGDVVVLTGRAHVDDAGLTASERASFDAKYARGFVDIGMTADEFHADYSVTVRVRVERLRGFR